MSSPGFSLRSGETWRDPFPLYRELREHDPVHHVADGDYWVLSRFDDVFDAARDTATFSSAQGLTTNYGEMEALGMDFAPMVMLDPPDHTAFRRMVARGFVPRRVETIEPLVRDFVSARVDHLREAGSADLVTELAKPLPSYVVGLYLGVPEADRDRFDHWTEEIVGANSTGDPLGAVEAVAELAAYFSELIERRRVEPGDDVVSDLVAVMDDPDSGTDAVELLSILGFAFTMVAGGNDTTTGLLGGAAELLTDRRDQRQLLLGGDAPIANAVEEFLRLTSPVQGLARTATTEVIIRGQVIPAGSKVLLLYSSANRDVEQFGPDAEQLDLLRKIDRILTFGYGAHHCLGAAAARLQARVAIEELLRQCPDFEVDAAAGEFAPGNYVRRYSTLPFSAGGH
ncbi:MAG: cytochrome P450 [Microthrixaceae bacterium]